MLMEMMGLHLPGAAFVHPNTPLRDALTAAAAKRAVQIGVKSNAYTPFAAVADEKSFVNGVAGLLATGGSTNHTLHLVAMARAAGIVLTWEDFHDLGLVTPLIARVYPNGSEDVKAFQAAPALGGLLAGTNGDSPRDAEKPSCHRLPAPDRSSLLNQNQESRLKGVVGVM